MKLPKRNIILSLILVAALILGWCYRNKNKYTPIKLSGKTMATTYHITYFDEHNRNFKISIDSLLEVVNKSINNYDSTSEISQFNSVKTGIRIKLPYLLTPLQISKKVFLASNGAYDPTVMTLVNLWGFGPEKRPLTDTAKILEIKKNVGFDKIGFNKDSVWKNNPKVKLDFGGIGQGYGADVIADFFKDKSITDFFIEVGGEGLVRGRNLQTNNLWKIGILDPNSNYTDPKFKAHASLKNRAYSTSGSYFNYHIVDGIKYSHTIDPKSGYPIKHQLLSVTIFAPDCTSADAWATAIMCLGYKKGVEVVEKNPKLDAFFIISTPTGHQTIVTKGTETFLTIL